MSEKDNGGAAFPGFDYISQDGKQNPAGMALRDYFAAKAMQAFTAAFAAEWSHAEIARAAYTQADTMLVERAK